MKIDTEVLSTYTKKDIQKFNKEVTEFLNKKKRTISREAVAFFYLSLFKIENNQNE